MHFLVHFSVHFSGAKLCYRIGPPGAAVARVLHEVVGEDDLAARLVAVQVVHAHVRVRAVGAGMKYNIISTISVLVVSWMRTMLLFVKVYFTTDYKTCRTLARLPKNWIFGYNQLNP